MFLGFGIRFFKHHLQTVLSGETPVMPRNSANFLYDKPFDFLKVSRSIQAA
tara:strand:- start:370 stop:522 length:153 start_codon:yes stop_codon:yes gene_type:complete